MGCWVETVASDLWSRYREIESRVPDKVAELIEEQLARIDEAREATEAKEKQIGEMLELLSLVTPP